MPSAIETEFKLTGSDEAVAWLRRSMMIRALAVKTGAREHYRTLFFDTPDEALARAGMSLRMRYDADALLQIVKVRGGLFKRREIETRLKSPRAFPAPTGVAAIDTKISAYKSRLKIKTIVNTDRQTIVLRRRNALIEAAFDRCVVNGAAPGAAHFSEAEFEILKGGRRALAELAALIFEEAGRAPSGVALSLSCAEKSLRARAALGGTLPPAPNSIALDPKASAGDALAAGLGFCAAAVMAASPLVTAHNAPEGVRRLRIALRRFRSIERLFRTAANDPALYSLALEARRYARVLGAARDWDVFVNETLAETMRAQPADSAMKERLEALRDAAERHRIAAWHDMLDEIRSADFARFVLALVKAARAGRSEKALKTPVRRFARKALEKRLREARKIGRTLDEKTPAAGHPLRISLKKLRYAAQLFRDLYARDARKPYMASMSYLQDAFGGLNDAVVAQDLANRAAKGQGSDVARAAGFVCGYRAAAAQKTASQIAESWTAFEAYPPFWRSK